MTDIANIQVIELTPIKPVTAARLRYILKRVLRDYGLRCLAIRYEKEKKRDGSKGTDHSPPTQGQG